MRFAVEGPEGVAEAEERHEGGEEELGVEEGAVEAISWERRTSATDMREEVAVEQGRRPKERRKDLARPAEKPENKCYV